MTEGGDYKSLIVWQKSVALVKTVFSLTGRFPDNERFGLTSQMRRAAVVHLRNSILNSRSPLNSLC